ncbi:MAG: DUF2975 domain-containing protein [Eubacteriales bacterium]|nr:DUF2975 domain-containing protein [Eubacteriales bacterium]MDD3200117.1 DUF2975 domain-containing protein [Eubacteriales bacterium]MDD4122077.1 DUF2975 domain-containing protein [Eubacteriales bacterium]MDD4630372.1 DUF2975 domain-containing protein [Eubacteriales bacterium]
MWNSSKSVLASSVCTKIVIVIVILTAVASPYLVKNYISYTMKDPDIITPLVMTIIACAVPGLMALFSLDRLLTNIKRKEVFIEKNVRHLRVISWCSFAVSVISLISGFYYLLFLIIAVAAAFFGLILRVVKNVIEQALIIKNENDFTI